LPNGRRCRRSARYVYRTTNSEIRLATGTTTVDWTLAGDGQYRLRMTTVALGMTVLELDSQGSLREFGWPERYVETRARRSPGGGELRLGRPPRDLQRQGARAPGSPKASRTASPSRSS